MTNKELKVQQYLREDSMETFKGLSGLKEEYGIKYSFGTNFPELICLKYNQIESPMGEEIVQECRGLILNVQDNWNIVSRPYDKFFNYGEGHAAPIDWNSAKVYEKLDGSLMTLYFYKGKWRVQTSGTVDAECQVSGYDITFKELFWQVFTSLEYLIPSHGEKELCFMFELMTSKNRVVVRHPKDRLVLHGVRNITTGLYEPIEYWAQRFNWEACKLFSLSSIEEIIKASNNLDPLEQEGYILEDANFNRIKVKSPSYVALHHTRDSMSPRSMLNIIRTNESVEFLNYFPEYKDLYSDTLIDYNRLIGTIEATIKDIYKQGIQEDYKQIGLNTKNLFYKGSIFQIIRNNRSIKDILLEMPIKKLEDWISKLPDYSK